jgi:uncharacterized protein (TIGR03435 family)
VTSSDLRRLVVITGMASLVLSSGAQAQSPPAFEVASIRRNLSGGMNTQINLSPGRLTVTNGSLKTLIRNAYDILSFQLTGELRWLDADMYDIVATTGTGGKISQDQFQRLLQSLLADRFRLRVHWETRETSVYALLPDKNGPKLHPGSATQGPGINTQKGLGRVHMQGTAEPISILAGNLGNQLGRFVLDKTGLPGVYDWVLEWSPDPAADASLPSLFTALREQLGLRLEAQKGPMEMLVIDNAERPSEN